MTTSSCGGRGNRPGSSSTSTMPLPPPQRPERWLTGILRCVNLLIERVLRERAPHNTWNPQGGSLAFSWQECYPDVVAATVPRGVAGTGVTMRRIVGWYKLGWSPEEIADRTGHLSLAQVYAALAYYHANREEIEADMAAEEAEAERLEREHFLSRQGS